MLKVDTNITTKEEAKAFVSECEARMEAVLEDAADVIAGKRGVKIVTLAGPTCSGKTTAAAKLTDAARRFGMRARVLSIDDFYKNSLKDDPNADFETADAIDTEYFSECVKGLLGGRSVKLPTFDFKRRERAALTEYVPEKNDIYIFEGIQAMYSEITSVFREYGYVSVAIGIFDDAAVGGNFFDKNDIRLTRRLLRDYRFRNTSVNMTMRLWKNVRSNEERNIYPFLCKSEYKIDSFLPYELMYIGKELVPLLSEADTDGEFSEKLSELRAKLENVRCNSISKDMIPLKSLYREFIG